MMDDNLRLRPLSIFDGHFIKELEDEALYRQLGRASPLVISFLSVVDKKTYSCFSA
jgi:hypothetical protein